MKHIDLLFLIMLLLLMPSCLEKGATGHRLKIDAEHPHYLVDISGDPVFLNGDTAWKLCMKLDREQVKQYLSIRKEQGYNAIGLAALFGAPENLYNDKAFHTNQDGSPDPKRPVVTEGNNPDNDEAYDYWDHLDYCMQMIHEMDLYACLVICFNDWVIDIRGRRGPYFDQESAYFYGNWIASRYRHLDNVLWMMGGDRPPVHEDMDRRELFAAMAEGVTDGLNGVDMQDGQADYSGHLISYHPRKREPRSSAWFHHAEWQTFNSVQACPYDQVEALSGDFSLKPVKPTWLWEGRYEGYMPQWDGWPTRFQAYQTVFSGGFGHIYGNKWLWQFAEGWEERMYDEGALCMAHLNYLMTEVLSAEQYLNRVPAPEIILQEEEGVVAGCWPQDSLVYSSFVVATKGPGFAMIYTPDGSPFSVDLSEIDATALHAHWYNPRYGMWYDTGDDYNYHEQRPFMKGLPAGKGADHRDFDPPYFIHPNNDWVLLLKEE